MSTTTLVTADELLALPMGMGQRYELVAGELRVMSPAGWRHGGVADNVAALLAPFIRMHMLGRGFAAETGFLLCRNPDTVRAPDYAFVSNARLPESEPAEAYWPGAPDLAVEVLSPNDTFGEVAEKVDEWLSSGCSVVWVIDPKLQTITIYESLTNVRILAVGDTLQGNPVLPGFSCNVGQLFQ